MLREQRRVQRGNEPDPRRHVGIGRDFNRGDCARTRAPADSVLCVLADDKSQVEAEDQGRATARVPWGWWLPCGGVLETSS